MCLQNAHTVAPPRSLAAHLTASHRSIPLFTGIASTSGRS